MKDREARSVLVGSAVPLALALSMLATACVAPAGDAPAVGPTGRSEVATSAATPAVAPEAKVEPFEESEVPRAAIAAETRLRAIRSLVGRTKETDAIVASERSVVASVEALKEWMRSREPAQQTSRALRSLRQEWLVDAETLERWMSTTGQRIDALAAVRVELRRLHERWSVTDAALEASGAAEQIRERARKVLVSIREAESRASDELDKLLLLQSRVSAAKHDSEEALDTIQAALQAGRKALFVVESEPIWALFDGGLGTSSFVAQVRSTIEEGNRALEQYVARARKNLVFQLVLFVLLIAVFHRLRPRIGEWQAEDRGLRACARLVERPILGAVLVTILGGLWLHPRAPLAFYEISSLLLVVPMVVVLRGIVRPEMRRVLTGVAAIFVVERVWELASAASLLARSILLVLTAVSVAVLVRAIRPRAPFEDAFSRRWWDVVTAAGRAALVLLGISFLSNAIGNVSLAAMLTALVVRAGYSGLVLYATALLLRGAVALALRSAAARSFHAIERHGEWLLARAKLAIDALAVVAYALLLLATTGMAPSVKEAAAAVFFEPWGVGGLRFSLASAAVFVAAIWASIVVSRMLRAVLEEDVYPRIALPRGVPSTLTMLIRYGVIAIGFLLALSIAGIPLDRLAIVLGAFSVGIGFGLQTVVNNFVSGLILMFERPIQIGDAVEVSGLVGRVRRIGVRASTIETFDGAEVIVPNGTLVSNQLINWTLSSRSRRVEVQVGVAYGSSTEKVLAILRDAIQGQARVLAQPEPVAIFRGFGASSLDFSLLFWTTDFEGWTIVRSEAGVRIERALREAGIEIPFPQHDVRIRR